MFFGVSAKTFSIPTPLPQVMTPTLSRQLRSKYNQLSEWTFTHSSKFTAAVQTLSSDLPRIIPYTSAFTLKVFSMCGLGASVIDCLVEPYGIGKNFKFLTTHALWKKPKKDLSPTELRASLQKIQDSYFEIPQEKQEAWTACAMQHFPANKQEQLSHISQEKRLYLNNKKLELGKCMGHRFAAVLQKQLPDLLQKLHKKKPSEEALQESKDLLNKIRSQACKSSVIQAIGLLAAILTTLFFVFTGFALLGGAFPLALAGLGSLFYLVRFILAAILPEINGWQFSLKTAVHHTVVQPIQSALNLLHKTD